MDAGMRGPPCGCESRCAVARGGTAARLEDRGLGERIAIEDETGENNSRKSAMKKSQQFFGKEAVLTWPEVVGRESALQKLAGILQNEFAEAWRACGLFEWIALGYMALSSVLIAFFARNLMYP